MREIDYLMEMNESGVIVHDDDKSQINQLKEWLDTPQGSIWGNPTWGNTCADFTHEPTHSSLTAVNIEFALLDGIERDLPHIQISDIWCEPHPEEIDRYQITIGTPQGTITNKVL